MYMIRADEAPVIEVTITHTSIDDIAGGTRRRLESVGHSLPRETETALGTVGN